MLGVELRFCLHNGGACRRQMAHEMGRGVARAKDLRGTHRMRLQMRSRFGLVSGGNVLCRHYGQRILQDIRNLVGWMLCIVADQTIALCRRAKDARRILRH